MGYVAGVLVILMMLIVLFEVFMRYVIGNPPAISDEIAPYMLVILAFGGAAYGFLIKGHVRVTALTEKLPPKVANWLRIFTLGLVLIYSAIVLQGSVGYLARSFEIGEKSTSWIRVPLQIPKMALPVGFALLALLVITSIIKGLQEIKAGKELEERR
jgi:C4-dicarboxylate transporter DctQ subunit